MRTFLFGEKLNNEALVIEATMVADNRHVVLARYVGEYAVWFVNNDGEAEIGSYSKDLGVAYARYKTRIERYRTNP